MRANLRQKEKLLWETRFYSIKELDNLPTAISVACSCTRNHFKYYHSGESRTNEKNCYVFQYSIKGFGGLRVGSIHYKISEEYALLVDVSDPNITYYLPKENTDGWTFLYFVFVDRSMQTKSIINEYGHVYNLRNHKHIIQKLLRFRRDGEQVFEISIGESIILVNSLLCSLIDIASFDKRDSTNAEIIRKAYRLIEKHISLPYNASLLADDLGISQEHLSRIFVKEIKISPYKLITKLKMRDACMLLKETSLPIKDVAIKIGNEPGSHFARAFRNEIGLSPLQFRKHGVLPF